MKYKILLPIVLLFITILLPFYPHQGLAAKLDKISLVLDWTPNTNHSGIIIAKALGYYQAEGLDIKINQPGKGSAEHLVARNLVNFAVGSEGSLVAAHIRGVPIISIAGIIAHNTSGFYSLKEKNILTPKDFEGKVYGSWGGTIELPTIRAMMEKFGADFDKVKVVHIGDIDFFKVKNIDFIWGYEAWTGILAEVDNIPVNYIGVLETIELDGYTPIIITNYEMINNHKDIVHRFMIATSRGYNYAIEHPVEAANILLKEYPELNHELVRASQLFISTKYKDRNLPWGYQTPSVWEKYVAWQFNNHVIDVPVDYTKLFTNEFIH